jgi:hypothetical protein
VIAVINFAMRVAGSVLKAVIVYTIDSPTPSNVRILVLTEVTLMIFTADEGRPREVEMLSCRAILNTAD